MGLRAEARAGLYHALAEALADPPQWLAGPGRTWPLFEAALDCAAFSEAARLAVAMLAEVPAEAPARRRARYVALFAGPGRPRSAAGWRAVATRSMGLSGNC